MSKHPRRLLCMALAGLLACEGPPEVDDTAGGGGDADVDADTDSDVDADTDADADADSDADSDSDTDVIGPVDADGDSYTDDVDCDDDDPAVNPGATEICENWIDDDCDGIGCALRTTYTPSEADTTITGDLYDTVGWHIDEGDLDGDGQADLVIGAQGWRYLDAWVEPGRVLVFYGPLPPGDLTVSDADAVLEGEADGDRFGTMFELIDLDDDGFDDMVIGAPGVDIAGADTDDGAVYVVYGGSGRLTGTSTVAADSDGFEADARLGTAVTDGSTGFRIKPGGDPNNDGFADVIIGAPGDLWEATGLVGGAWLVSGAATRLSGQLDLAATATAHIGGPAASEALGYSVVGGLDADGDGIDDLFVGATSAWWNWGATPGEVYVFRGPVSGTFAPSDAWAVLEGEATFDSAGADVDVGDLDGDGAPELIVGAAGFRDPSAQGMVYALTTPLVAGTTALSTAPWRIEGGCASDYLGDQIDIGDWNNDGQDDLVLTTTCQRGFVMLGPLPAGAGLVTDAARSATLVTFVEDASDTDQCLLGYPSFLTADVSGDGLNDAVVADHCATYNGADSGRVRIYRGVNGF